MCHMHHEVHVHLAGLFVSLTAAHSLNRFRMYALCDDASFTVQNALSDSKSEQQCASLEWQQQTDLLHIQLQQQEDTLRHTHQQIAALKAGHDEQQRCMQQQHAEVSLSHTQCPGAQQLQRLYFQAAVSHHSKLSSCERHTLPAFGP